MPDEDGRPRPRDEQTPGAPPLSLRQSYGRLASSFGQPSMLLRMSTLTLSLTGLALAAAAAVFAAGVYAERHPAPGQP
jgi:hypothetical protein